MNLAAAAAHVMQRLRLGGRSPRPCAASKERSSSTSSAQGALLPGQPGLKQEPARMASSTGQVSGLVK